MSLTKKEKTLIFVLIVIMIVGGFYMYGITPMNEKKADNEELLEQAQAALKSVEDQYYEVNNNGATIVSNEIEQIQAEMDKYTGNVTETGDYQFWSSNDEQYKKNYSTMVEVQNKLKEWGLTLYSTQIGTFAGNPTIDEVVFQAQYECRGGIDGIKKFLNSVDKEMSLLIAGISIAQTESGALGGTITLHIKIAVGH